MKRLLIAECILGVVVAISAACFFFWPASIEAVQATHAQPTGSALVAKGEYLTKAADCAACHTAPGGKPFAGGRAFKLPFGTIYSTNITPDRETGIGQWSDAEFVRALHKGIGKNGEDLYPAFRTPPMPFFRPTTSSPSVPTFQLCGRCPCETPTARSFSRSTSGTR
jgi:hypothetical protein